ncbi:hypothetical protein IKE_06217, partial [Bacillus cereus VD196]
TLFTPIVDVLPGKYNIVHAEETQNPAKYSVINASNKWEGLSSATYGTAIRDYGNYVNYKSQYPNLSFRAEPLRGYAQTAVEVKVRTDADQVHQLDLCGYHLGNRQWQFASQPFTPLTDEVPEPGEWAVWKVTYDKIAQKKTFYLNGKKIVERDINGSAPGISDSFFGSFNMDNNTRVSTDIEYVNISYTAISNEKPVITGEEKTSLKQGSTFDPLSGMSATDKEDGDLTEKLKITENTVDSK